MDQRLSGEGDEESQLLCELPFVEASVPCAPRSCRTRCRSSFVSCPSLRLTSGSGVSILFNRSQLLCELPFVEAPGT